MEFGEFDQLNSAHDGMIPKDKPVIFQCKSCHAILSDSLALVAAHDELKHITVNQGSSILQVSSKLVTSTNGIDQGSTYSPLMCSGCEGLLGKVYRTTPRSLDSLRDYFTFDVNRMTIYQVGSAGMEDPLSSESFLEQHTSLKSLKETTLKLQVLLCSMHQRILNIEQSLDLEDTSASGSKLHALTELNGRGLAAKAHTVASSYALQDPIRAREKAAREKPLQQNGSRQVASARGKRDGQLRDLQDHKRDAAKRTSRQDHRRSDSHQSSDGENSGIVVSKRSSQEGRGRGRGRGRGGGGGGGGARSSRGRDVGGSAVRGGQTPLEPEPSLEQTVRGLKSTSDRLAMQTNQGGLDQGLAQLTPIKKRPNKM